MNIEQYMRTKGKCLDFSLEKRSQIRQFTQKTILGEDYNADTMEFGDISFFPNTNLFFGKKEINGQMFYVFFDPMSQLPIYQCNTNDGLSEEVVKVLREEIFIPGEEKFREMYFRIQKEVLAEENKDVPKAD